MKMSMEETIHKIIDELYFGVFSPQDIRRLSVAEIQTADTYDEDGAPITSGLMDGRLGTLEPRQRCKTCGNTAIRCPGHFGHIELAVPIIHIEFTKIIHKLLQATCRNCGRILLHGSGRLQGGARGSQPGRTHYARLVLLNGGYRYLRAVPLGPAFAYPPKQRQEHQDDGDNPDGRAPLVRRHPPHTNLRLNHLKHE